MHIYAPSFFSLGSFMAAKTEHVVLLAKVGHTELWNLLCNLATGTLRKYFVFHPFSMFSLSLRKSVSSEKPHCKKIYIYLH